MTSRLQRPASRRCLAAGKLGAFGIVARGHAPDIASQVLVSFGRRAQRRVVFRTQRAGYEGEHGGIDAGWLCPHEERLLPEKGCDRVDTLDAKLLDLVAAVAPHALGMQI